MSPAAHFDVHVVVDWSAAGVPTRGRDSIWCAIGGVGPTPKPVNLPTRREAVRHLDELIASHAGRRILIGFDFPFGYPTGTAAALGLAGDPWRSTWDLIAGLIVDGERNANNRFDVAAELNRRLGRDAGRFWGCPVGGARPGLAATKGDVTDGPAEYRRCEQELRAGGRRPLSVWQLFYPGSVGGQALTGIPALRSLLGAHPRRVEVWPFTTGLGPRPAGARPDGVVLAEVWPSRFTATVPPGVVKDAFQVSQTLDALAAADWRGELQEWFDPRLPVAARDDVEREEGWILGPPVGATGVS